jgi:hypothetical protein
MAQSQKLTDFYNAYNNWLNDGAPAHELFSRETGLCSCIIMWLPGYLQIIEMRSQFAAASLSTCYPFNEEFDDYLADTNKGAHLNPKRIQWVKDHLS